MPPRNQSNKPATSNVSGKSPEEILNERALKVSGLTAEDYAALSDEEKQKHLDAAKVELDAEAEQAKKAVEESKKPKLVKMKRDKDVFEEPHSAEVHPDEVTNFQQGGWVTA